MDPVTLSTGVAVLARLLPFLTGVGEAAGEAAAGEFGTAIGTAAVRRSTQLWDKIWPQLRNDPGARQAVGTLARKPNRDDAQQQLAAALARILAGDPKLADEVSALVEQVHSRGVAVDTGRVDVDVRVTGDNNVVQYGNDNNNLVRARGVNLRWRG
jgi:hypothetical protein